MEINSIIKKYTTSSEIFAEVVGSFKGRMCSIDKTPTNSFALHLYSPEAGTSAITFSKSTLTPELISFLQSKRFIGYDGIRIRRFFLLFHIDINICVSLHDLAVTYFKNTLSAYSVASKLSITPSLNYAETDYFIYAKLIGLLSPDHLRGMREIISLFAYGEYFGITSSFNYKANLEEYHRVSNLIKSIKNKYALDLSLYSNKKKLLPDVKRFTKQYLKEYIATLDPVLGSKKISIAEDLIALEEAKNTLFSLRFIDSRIGVLPPSAKFIYAGIGTLYPMYVTKPLIFTGAQRSIKCNSKKAYYIRISGAQVQYKYLEYLNTGNDLGDKNYYKVKASEIFNKPATTISDEEYRAVKYYCNTHLYGSLTNPIIHPLPSGKYKEVLDRYFSRYPDNYFTKKGNLTAIQRGLLIALGNHLQKYKNKVILNSIYNNELIFKVSNSINPIRIAKELLDILDTTKTAGIRLYRVTSFFHKYTNIRTARTLTIAEINARYNTITNEKVENVLSYVYRKY